MEMQLIQKLAVEVSLDHPKEDDSREIKALLNVCLILMHVATGIVEIQNSQKEILARLD